MFIYFKLSKYIIQTIGFHRYTLYDTDKPHEHRTAHVTPTPAPPIYGLTYFTPRHASRHPPQWHFSSTLYLLNSTVALSQRSELAVDLIEVDGDAPRLG